ncbi:MAG: hypothetical protein HPY74_19940 [Firmicutes bacterium]|nr:hypothetical protein [Bacillota bacterium]
MFQKVFPRGLSLRLSTTRREYGIRKFKVTHQFSPLFGKEFELIERKLTWGEDRLLYIDDKGEMYLMPASWTDVCDPDPFIVVSNGRSDFKYDDLLELSRIIKGIQNQG